MRDEMILFLSQFLLVFLLGFQSQNIRDKKYCSAMLGSMFIGLLQLFQWRVMPNATGSQMVVWLCAGPLGIVAAMWLHPKICKKRIDKKN